MHIFGEISMKKYEIQIKIKKREETKKKRGNPKIKKGQQVHEFLMHDFFSKF